MIYGLFVRVHCRKVFFSIFRRPPNPITRFKPVCACVPEYGVPETLRIRKA